LGGGGVVALRGAANNPEFELPSMGRVGGAFYMRGWTETCSTAVLILLAPGISLGFAVCILIVTYLTTVFQLYMGDIYGVHYAGSSNFSVRGAARWAFFSASGAALSQEVPTAK
jgi:hypothetical protein